MGAVDPLSDEASENLHPPGAPNWRIQETPAQEVRPGGIRESIAILFAFTAAFRTSYSKRQTLPTFFPCLGVVSPICIDAHSTAVSLGLFPLSTPTSKSASFISRGGSALLALGLHARWRRPIFRDRFVN